MARYQATVPSHRPAAETFTYLATFSNAAEWDPGVLAGEQLDPGRFWHDRRPRPEHLLPWTREKDPAAARDLWDHLATCTATPAQPGRVTTPDPDHR